VEFLWETSSKTSNWKTKNVANFGVSSAETSVFLYNIVN
jgi:ABC-type transporter MlaC component